MKAELREKWVQALRSGKYQQGKGMLRTVDDHYCCLGVLADVADPEAWGSSCTYGESGVEEFLSYNWEGDEDLFAADNLDMLGLNEAWQDELAGLNDRGATFAEIADFIEKHDVGSRESWVEYLGYDE